MLLKFFVSFFLLAHKVCQLLYIDFPVVFGLTEL